MPKNSNLNMRQERPVRSKSLGLVKDIKLQVDTILHKILEEIELNSKEPQS